MPGRVRVVRAIVVTGWIAAACAPRTDPISIQNQTLYVENRTSEDWRSVVVTVNDHFRGGAAVLAAGSRLTAPLSQFETAFGQRYDTARQAVVKVEVTATGAGGTPVRLQLKR
jgi:hypothetical protein